MVSTDAKTISSSSARSESMISEIDGKVLQISNNVQLTENVLKSIQEKDVFKPPETFLFIIHCS